MNVIISYDISDEKRLRKVAKFLEGECVRVQNSVFLLPRNKKDELKRIVKRVLDLISEEDSVKVYYFDVDKAISNYDIKNFIV